MRIEDFNDAVMDCTSEKGIEGMRLVILKGKTVAEASREVGITKQAIQNHIDRRFNVIVTYQKKLKKGIDKLTGSCIITNIENEKPRV